MSDFFNNLISNFDKGIQAVSSRGKELIEISKLKLEISNIKSSIKRKYAAVGEKTYQMFSKSEFNAEVLKVDCEEITNLIEKIANIEATIKNMETPASKNPHEEAVTCSKCGAINKAGDKFCKGCNAEIIKETASEDKKCHSCGTPAMPESTFCSKCGIKID